ncbi:hypothetical protein GX48_02764 [Paracoccidioides brasiliensis]|nr:hypothetical protein GX48_02764 [Paracoccidioides brasiliensis]
MRGLSTQTAIRLIAVTVQVSLHLITFEADPGADPRELVYLLTEKIGLDKEWCAKWQTNSAFPSRCQPTLMSTLQEPWVPAFDRRLQNKTALITGGAAGIGLAIATSFLEQGAMVLIVDFSQPNLDRARVFLKQKGVDESRYVLHQADAADEESVIQSIEKCWKVFGAMDISILNAGIGGREAPIVEQSLEDFDKLMHINARGAFIGLKESAKKMIAMKRPGAIVLTCSTAGLRSRPNIACYSMTKFAVRTLAITAAKELMQYGIRVNSVCPGIVETALLDLFPNAREIAAQSPIGRVGQPDEIAKVFLFLASDEASFVTGSCYKVDGGWLDH